MTSTTAHSTPEETLSIRHAIPDDEGYLMALTHRLAAFPLPSWRTADEIAHADRGILRDALHGEIGGAAILVAELAPGGERAGFLFATTKLDYFTRKPHAHVEVLVVDPAAEGRGVASSLMAAGEDWAQALGLDAMTLNVFDRNSRAQGLYEHLGYQRETIHYRKAL
jgi:ribosomal protein S18 acetylase RimI-like enzyme